MRTSTLNRFAVTAAMFSLTAACGGSQPPIGVPGGVPQTNATATHADRGKSWMLPGASSGALIYATGGCGGTCVITYPALEYVGALSTAGASVCSDHQGNVFIPEGGSVTEYAHGGSQSIATLNLPGQEAQGCSVDSRTENLAVVFKGYNADVAIFPNEQGTPTLYGTGIDSSYCGFDDKGNLYVDGCGSGTEYVIAELPAGSGTFAIYRLDNSVGTPGQVQWDGKYITYESLGVPSIISRLRISGSKANVVDTVTLDDIRHRQLQSWIYGGNIIVPYNDRGRRQNIVGVWKYPKGGKTVKSIRKFDSFKKIDIWFQGVTLSI